MKLIFDANLSAALVPRLADQFPDSTHVRSIRLSRASDEEIWDYARSNSLVVVSKDSDFQELSVLRGHPPKVIWIRRGNCTTNDIERLLRESVEHIAVFEADSTSSLLMLF